MQIDIRAQNVERVTEILFWEQYWQDAHKIVLKGADALIADGDAFICIRSAEHARYLIKALEKAIEIGTWN